MSRARALAAGGAALLALSAAHALDATQVFEKASPSVWVVRTYDGAERPVGQGSAVVIAPGRLITNCHVLAKSRAVVVRRENVMYQATLEHADAPRDLCLLQVANFHAPAVQLRPVGELKVGERVFALGNPQGFEVTLSEGLISGLRGELPGLPVDQGGGNVVQTTAPISPGSSGGGLFDAEGRLIGITSLIRRNAQNINIALPTDWISEVPARAQAALAARHSPQFAGTTAKAAVPPGYPAPGTLWTYSFTERLFARRKIDVTIRALRVDDGIVEESVVATGRGGQTATRAVDSRTARFVDFAVDESNLMVELSPYLVAASGDDTPVAPARAEGYPLGSSGLPAWDVTVEILDWEQVSVSAGSFRALRVRSEGRRRVGGRGGAFAGEFKMTAWYSPDVKRLVRLESKVWSADAYSPALINDTVLELIAYRPPS